MRFRLRTLLIVLALMPALIWATVGLAARLRLAVMRASCTNGLKQQVSSPVAWRP